MVVTTNAYITGTFNVTDSLHLVTTSGQIDVAATLYHDGAHPASKNATMITTNGGISARTNLLSSAPARTGVSFALTLATKYGRRAGPRGARTAARQCARVHGRDDARTRGCATLGDVRGRVRAGRAGRWDEHACDCRRHGCARSCRAWAGAGGHAVRGVARHVAGEVSWGSVQLSNVGKAVTLHA